MASFMKPGKKLRRTAFTSRFSCALTMEYRQIKYRTSNKIDIPLSQKRPRKYHSNILSDAMYPFHLK